MERNLMVAGFGGQGVMTLGKFLAEATCDSTDKNVTFFPSYGAEQRGGTANCYVVISDEKIGAPLGDTMDDLIVMNGPSLNKFLYKLVPGGTLYINSSIVNDEITRSDVKVVKAPVTELALELGNAKVLNIIMLLQAARRHQLYHRHRRLAAHRRSGQSGQGWVSDLRRAQEGDHHPGR